MVFFYSANFSSFPQNVSHLSIQTVNEWKKKKKHLTEPSYGDKKEWV